MNGPQAPAPARVDARRLMDMIAEVYHCADCHHDYTCARHSEAFAAAYGGHLAPITEDEVTVFMQEWDNPRVHTLGEKFRRAFNRIMASRGAAAA